MVPTTDGQAAAEVESVRGGNLSVGSSPASTASGYSNRVQQRRRTGAHLDELQRKVTGSTEKFFAAMFVYARRWHTEGRDLSLSRGVTSTWHVSR
jgi:hypothetical protein